MKAVIIKNWALSAIIVLLGLSLGGAWIYGRWLAQMPDGVDCPILTEAEVAERGLDFYYQFPSTMRDPVNGILVVTAVGQAYPECKQAFSTFRCNAAGPSQVRVMAGPSVMYFDVPEGQTAIVQGDGSGRTACTLP